jgi:Sap, sulfolipid-1-addressing protein
MDNVFLTLVPSAIGVAISPAAIIELILVLFSVRRAVNATAFIVTLLAMTALALGIGSAGGQATRGDSAGPSPVVSWVFVVLGLLLLYLGVQNWRNRADTSEPAMFAKVTSLGPGAVAFLAFGAVAMNPKNTVLLLASGQTISTASRPWLVGVGFVVLATLPYTVATGYALFGGAAADARLDRMRIWLVGHNRLIMGVVCGLLGLVLTLKGAAGVL